MEEKDTKRKSFLERGGKNDNLVTAGGCILLFMGVFTLTIGGSLISGTYLLLAAIFLFILNSPFAEKRWNR